MSFVRFIPNVNRLGAAMTGPGGKKLSAALDDAQTLLDEARPPCLEGVDAALAAIVAADAISGPLSAAAREAIYADANQINGMAGLFGLAEMGKAAWSLCELIDISESDPPSTRASITTHVRSLQLLRSGEAVPEVERVAILAGLERVLTHVRAEAA